MFELLPYILFIFALGYVYTVPANDTDYPDELYIIELQDEKLDRDGAIACTGTQMWDKGADIASADPLVPGADGNLFHITGTTNFTAINAAQSQPGTVHCYVFDGILTMTHHATDLILPGGANITTAAGDRAIFIEESADKWRCLVYQRADGTPIAGGGIANLIKNGSFESWSAGTANQVPDGWTKIGTPTDVSRDTGDRDNFGAPYAAKITSNGAGNEGLTVTLSNLKASKKYIVICRAKATSADTAKIWTTGGSANLSEITTSTSWVTLSGTFTTDATPTNIVLKIGSDTATDIVWFDAIIVLEGEAIKQFSPHPNDQHLKAIDYQDNALSNYDFGLLRIETGKKTLTFDGVNAFKVQAITFGTAFTTTLVVLVCSNDTTGLTHVQYSGECVGHTITTTGFTIQVNTADGSVPDNTDTKEVSWIAIGVN